MDLLKLAEQWSEETDKQIEKKTAKILKELIGTEVTMIFCTGCNKEIESRENHHCVQDLSLVKLPSKWRKHLIPAIIGFLIALAIFIEVVR